jgi:mRNA interferase RelE/StbE
LSYQVLVKPAARRQLKKLPPLVQKHLIDLIDSLAEQPRPLGSKKLKGRQNQYRVRSGNYRVLYSIEDESLVIRIIKVGHRRDIYEE